VPFLAFFLIIFFYFLLCSILQDSSSLNILRWGGSPALSNHLRWASCAGILEHSMGARNREGIGLSYWPARLHRLAESISWNRAKPRRTPVLEF
jgi:hypothetical protein